MKCTVVDVGNGSRAIVCGSKRYELKRCACGNVATKLCDWIVRRAPKQTLAGAIGVFKLETCDAPLCDRCAKPVDKGKDLCHEHDREWEGHPANKQRKLL